MSDLIDPEEPEEHKEYRVKFNTGGYIPPSAWGPVQVGDFWYAGEQWEKQIYPNYQTSELIHWNITPPIETTEDKIRRHILKIENLLIEKNRKYGDSAINPVRIFSNADPAEQLRVRLDDKISRLAQGEMDDDEDTLLDLVGYIVLLLVALEKD